MLTSVPGRGCQQPADETLFLIPVPSVSRVVLSPVVSLVSSSRSSRGPRDLRGRLHDLLRFGIPSKRDEVSRWRSTVSGVMKIRPVFVSAGPLRRPRCCKGRAA